MKSLSSLKSNNKVDSPKTPGGISKSLLTPCRRVGLSRNWRKSGPSPFISPLSSSAEVNLEKKETRKRKESSVEEVSDIESTEGIDYKEKEENSSQKIKKDNETISQSNCCEIETTPSRNISLPKRKKSRTTLSTKIEKAVVDSPVSCPSRLSGTTEEEEIALSNLRHVDLVSKTIVTTPIRVQSQGKTKKLSKCEISTKLNIDEAKENSLYSKEHTNIEKLGHSKENSPDNLTKGCFVLIQKKIFKKALEQPCEVKKEANTASQALFDSDTDDVPLSVLNIKEEKQDKLETITVIDEDDDFIENTKVNLKKQKDKMSTGELKCKPNVKNKVKEKKETANTKALASSTNTECKPSSQSSFDDDGDFVIDKKRTILIRKSYDKVTKPCKAKSTGSITQRDIDELKARIEMKKKLLLAKAMGNETEELRSLIKKWQKGCQDALMELMDLMKIKCQDKKNMDYSEILDTLKIPPELVGYDEENDCFSTPSDENIILSKFNNL